MATPSPSDPFSAADKALRGRDALFPFGGTTAFGKTAVGGDRLGPLGYPGLESLLVAPPLFTPLRMERMLELGREPVHTDVDTRVHLGGFVASMPVTVGAMGSTDIANRHGCDIARAAGHAGIVMSIGENVATMRGYDRRIKPDEPSLKERMLAYLEACPDGEGGLLLQQSVEDADAELWNRVYADPAFAPYLDQGMVGFEIKAGQGAKPGLGGEVRVSRDEARRLKGRFKFPEDPDRTDLPHYDRHCAPGTFSADILANQLRLIKNNFPKARLWLKLGGYRDLAQIIRVAESAGVDAVTLDGHAAGTGMAPTVALRHLGVPTLACLGLAAAHRRSGSRLTMLVSGGLSDGADAMKAVACGASGIALGRPFLEAAAAAGEEGVQRFLAVVKEEVQLLASAVGKYHMEDLTPEDLVATDPHVGAALGVPDMYGVPAQDAVPAHSGAKTKSASRDGESVAT
ncbi:MAG: alpha-hydroxy-acid oxidizing protein [Euryarchaeota archaeon]|nr:alpha-hydroxy-acid oxidizing protein [Euryarchaeota archaeon]